MNQYDEYRWYTVMIVKGRNSFIKFLESKIDTTFEVKRIYFPTNSEGRPVMSYLFIQCIPGYLESVHALNDRTYKVVGELSEAEIQKMENADLHPKQAGGISVGSMVEFFDGNYMGFTGEVSEVASSGEIEVKVWFMDTLTTVVDHIKNVKLCDKRGNR